MTINPGGGNAQTNNTQANQTNNGGSNTASNNQTQTRQQPRKRYIESLSYCKPSKHVDNKWFCEGKIQKVFVAENLNESLSASGCKTIRKWVPLNEGRLYFCPDGKIDPSGDTGKITWHRDIARWISIPAAILADRRDVFE